MSRKNYEKEKLIRKKGKGGIWITNKFGKIKSKRRHPPTPLIKKCGVIGCEKRVSFHHYLCQTHWNEKNNLEKNDKKKIDTQKDKSL